MLKYHAMRKIYIMAVLAATVFAASCGWESRQTKKEHAAETVTNFYMHIQAHEYEDAMRCTDLGDREAESMASLFEQLGMEIHKFHVDTVTLDPGDTVARVHLSLRVSNAFASDTAETSPVIPCIKTRDGWRVKFDF